MSCQQRSGRVATRAAVQSGIGSVTSKAGNVIGTVAGQMGDKITGASRVGQSAGQTMMAMSKQKTGAAVNRWAATQDALDEKVVGRVAPVSNVVLNRVDRPTVTLAKAAPYVAGALAALRFRGYLVTGQGGPPVAAVAVAPRSMSEIRRNKQTINRMRRAVGTAGTVSALSASVAVWATKDKSGSRALALKKNDKVMAEVGFQKSEKITRFLNKLDLVGSHRLGKNVVSSEGDIVQVPKGGRWHRGTSVVQTASGQHTITHLQSLKLPAQHYYFDRKLSDEEVAGIITGREKAPRMKGYVGEVHSMENLIPSWGATKKAMITTRLYHPSAEVRWSAAEKKA